MFTSKRAGPLLLVTKMSIPPSLFTSPNTAARLTSLCWNAGPAEAVMSSKALPLAHIAEQQVAFVVRKRLALLRRDGLNRSICTEHVQQTPIPDIQQPHPEAGIRQGNMEQPGLRGGIHIVAMRPSLEQSEPFDWEDW